MDQTGIPRRYLLRSLCAVTLAGLAGTFSPSPAEARMNVDRIAALAALHGDAYETEKRAFLAEEEPLVDYPYELAQADPRFRVQYLILMGWQQHGDLYSKIEKELAEINADAMRKTAAGLAPLYSTFRADSAEHWQRDGLPFAWELVLKSGKTRPDWQWMSAMAMIQGYPHADSVDALMIGLREVSQASDQHAEMAATLRDMPVEDIRTRLELDQQYYVDSRPDLKAAARGR